MSQKMILITKDGVKASADNGINMLEFEKGDVYPVARWLGNALIARKVAVEATPEVIAKSLKLAGVDLEGEDEPVTPDPEPIASDPEPATSDPEPATSDPEPATSDPEPHSLPSDENAAASEPAPSVPVKPKRGRPNRSSKTPPAPKPPTSTSKRKGLRSAPPLPKGDET